MTKELWRGEDVINGMRGTGPTAWAAMDVSIDSRTVQPGDLFIALKGPAHDGHDHVTAAFQAGAAAAIVSRIAAGMPKDAVLIQVPDTFAALQDLGSTGRARARGQIIGVTGSVGKTGSKEQLRHILKTAGKTFASQGSFNNHWGVPLSLARLPADAAWGIFEMGMNHAGEIAPLTRQVQPHVALITTVEAVHLEFFKSVEGIADAKAEIFLGMTPEGVAILPRDNPHYARLLGHARTQGLRRILSFGIAADCDARLLSCASDNDGCVVEANFFGQPLRYRIGAAGRHYAMNSLACLLAAQAAGADLATAAATLATYHPPEGRGQKQSIALPRGGALTLLDESYNASPVAMQAAIAVLGQTQTGPQGRRIAVLGDMRELGQTAPQLHAELATHLVKANVAQVFCCGHLMSGLFDALPPALRGRYTADSKELLPAVLNGLRPGDVVLVKGSKSVKMDVIVDAIKALARHAA